MFRTQIIQLVSSYYLLYPIVYSIKKLRNQKKKRQPSTQKLMNHLLAEWLAEDKGNMEWMAEVGNNIYHLRPHDQVESHGP